MIQFALRALDAAASALSRKKQLPEDTGQPSTRPEAAHLATGRRGEEEAYFYLRGLGYVMVARNWRSPRHRGEIDLIGWDGDVLCFVEVKTRTTRDVKPAEAAVDDDKQRELSRMALDYLRRASSRRLSVASRRSLERQQTKVLEVAKVSTEVSPKSEAATGNWPLTTGPFPPYRFDIVSVYYDENPTAAPAITLFRSAFAVA